MNTKIIISEGTGFCMGVKRAYNRAFELALTNKHLCIYGDIVHNSYAVKELTERQVTIKNSLEDIICDTTCNPVIIRTHGVPPSVLERLQKAGKEIYDLTCPVVKKIHSLIQEAVGRGKSIIIFGKKDHPEVVGFKEFITTPLYIIKNLDEARLLLFSEISNPLLISQTTMNSDSFEEVSAYLAKKWKDLEIKNTLCNFPLSIQKNGVELANKVDLMVVVGDKKSSNTKTLFEKVSKVTESLFVEHTADLENINPAGYSSIGLAGGASTPDSQIRMIYDYLMEMVNKPEA